jgi:hypothetical protein
MPYVGAMPYTVPCRAARGAFPHPHTQTCPARGVRWRYFARPAVIRFYHHEPVTQVQGQGRIRYIQQAVRSLFEGAVAAQARVLRRRTAAC